MTLSHRSAAAGVAMIAVAVVSLAVLVRTPFVGSGRAQGAVAVAPSPPVAGKLYVPESGVVPEAVGVARPQIESPAGEGPVGEGGGVARGAAPSAANTGDAGVTGGGGVITRGGSSGVAADDAARSDYPTVARADYVFACMQVNGQTRETLEKCACSLDVIASLLPFVEYEEAETVMSVRQRGGKSISIFENGPIKEKVKVLKRAQVEGELRCF